MTTLRFSITISAPKEKVWDTTLGRDSYRVWTEVFAPGSYYVGEWSKGSKILFLSPGAAGRRSDEMTANVGASPQVSSALFRSLDSPGNSGRLYYILFKYTVVYRQDPGERSRIVLWEWFKAAGKS